MITLEQIQLLDRKVKDAIELISKLREENRFLTGKVEARELTIARLEEELSLAQTDNDRIEEGFNEALSRLDQARNEDDLPNQRDGSVEASEPRTGESKSDEPAQEEVAETEAEADEPEEATEPEPPREEEAFQENDVAGDDEPLQETMQFEEAEQSADEPASEEPDIDEGIPLTSDDAVAREESQVNHSERREDEESRSPQDLDIF